MDRSQILTIALQLLFAHFHRWDLSNNVSRERYWPHTKTINLRFQFLPPSLLYLLSNQRKNSRKNSRSLREPLSPQSLLREPAKSVWKWVLSYELELYALGIIKGTILGWFWDVNCTWIIYVWRVKLIPQCEWLFLWLWILDCLTWNPWNWGFSIYMFLFKIDWEVLIPTVFWIIWCIVCMFWRPIGSPRPEFNLAKHSLSYCSCWTWAYVSC